MLSLILFLLLLLFLLLVAMIFRSLLVMNTVYVVIIVVIIIGLLLLVTLFVIFCDVICHVKAAPSYVRWFQSAALHGCTAYPNPNHRIWAAGR